jgi:hypothetical protein
MSLAYSDSGGFTGVLQSLCEKAKAASAVLLLISSFWKM